MNTKPISDFELEIVLRWARQFEQDGTAPLRFSRWDWLRSAIEELAILRAEPAHAENVRLREALWGARNTLQVINIEHGIPAPSTMARIDAALNGGAE